jgi:streptogrisin C
VIVVKNSRLGGSVAVVVALGAAFGLPAASAPPAPARAAAGPPLAQIQQSVDYLAATYGVSTGEAVRRVLLGADSVELGQRLAQELPQDYAGMWLDQRAGTMVVLATDTGRAREVVRTLPHAGEIRVQPARFSRPELDRTSADAQSALGAAGYAEVNQKANRVDVWTDRHDAAAKLAGRGLDPAAYAIHANPHGTPTDCTVFVCDPPFRGGISVELKTNVGDAPTYCTSAFNLIDDLGNFYATTAGHCITRAGTNPQALFHDNRLVATRAGAVIRDANGPLRDFAVMPIPNPALWMPVGPPHNIIKFHCELPSPSICFDSLNLHRYQILAVRDYANMAVGNLVCMAGASVFTALVDPGTRCGEITALPGGAIQTNICARRGDSGSPLFNQVTREAFGIESQVVPPNNPLVTCATDAPHATLYTPISRVLDIASNATGRVITVIIVP